MLFIRSVSVKCPYLYYAKYISLSGIWNWGLQISNYVPVPFEPVLKKSTFQYIANNIQSDDAAAVGHVYRIAAHKNDPHFWETLVNTIGTRFVGFDECCMIAVHMKSDRTLGMFIENVSHRVLSAVIYRIHTGFNDPDCQQVLERELERRTLN